MNQVSYFIVESQFPFKKWTSEKFHTGGKIFHSYKEVTKIKKWMQSMNSSIKFKVQRLPDKNFTGWAYYKRGVVGQGGKNHYLKDWKSLCGQYEVGIEERKHVHFVNKLELRQWKICKHCVRIIIVHSNTRFSLGDFKK